MTQTEDRILELIVLSITPGDLHNPWSDAPRRLAATIVAEIDALTAELAQRTLERDAAQETLGMCQRWADDHTRKVTAQLAEARAEVERLRPAAEAWLYKQACIAWDAGKITPFEFAEAHKLYSPQARRARAAKERKP